MPSKNDPSSLPKLGPCRAIHERDPQTDASAALGSQSERFMRSCILIDENGTAEMNFPVELDANEIEIITYVLDSKLTMTSLPRLINTVKSCVYVVENNIPGDFVECGVWRGGNGILARKIFEQLGSDKKVWMFDTFEGMTEPTELDVAASSKEVAIDRYRLMQQETHNDWCYASLDDVKNNCLNSNLDLEDFKFVKGDVFKTLTNMDNVPDCISVLRLDTDWYESTKIELELLYPIISKNGVLIIDDYGHWEGARKAVDEYFSSKDYKPMLNVVDYTGRTAVKN
ncbi:MAG: TylF/MycF/NovP-related O-methyltransferase [Hoeflea sp.]|uniref:TylF/MycF/NovP-related O-methyltransferase n=1 Tax=Hoeflea sp. TaxID=1940281 RepID=UPI003EF65BF6